MLEQFDDLEFEAADIVHIVVGDAGTLEHKANGAVREHGKGREQGRINVVNMRGIFGSLKA